MKTHPVTRPTAWTVALLMAAFVSSASAIERTYKYFRYSPTTFRDSNTNSVQISEITFLRSGLPLSRSGVLVTNPGGNTPANEGPANLIDGSTNTKWLDFNKAPVVFEFPSAVTIDGYNFATANDASGRDPVSWNFEGSDDNANWNLLDVVTNYATPLNRQVFAAASASTGFPLKGVVISRFAPNKAIVLDGQPVILDWQTFLASSASIDQGVGPVAVNGPLTITPPPGTTTPYTLSATNGSDIVTAITNVRSVVGGVSRFQFVRFSPRFVRGSAALGNIPAIQLSELRFRSNGTTLTPVTVTNPGGAMLVNEGPDKLSDGLTTTKWFNNNPAPLIFDFGTPVDFDSYYLSTGNDATERDPLRWIIEGSNNQTEWTLIDNVTAFDYTTPMGRQVQTDDIPLPGPSLTPVINLFVGDAPTLVAGEPLRLTWSTSGTAVTIDQGVGSGAGSGSVVVSPTSNVTYTLTAGSGGNLSTATFTVKVITPDNTIVAYEDFNISGEEIVVRGDAAVVFDPAISQPEPADRLRITPNSGGKSGFAWFAKRQNLADGFQSLFDLQFIANTGNPGADGMAFVIQNTPQGNGLTFINPENGSPVNALNVTFDSFDNDGAGGSAEPSSAAIRVSAGTTILATVDLSTFPGLMLADFTQPSNDAAPYRVRIDYRPGDLDIYFNDFLVLDSLNVDLVSIGAVDSLGTAYTGFAGRTGGFFENHDVTRWLLTEGLPPAASALTLLSHVFDFEANQLTLTWASSGSKTYRIRTSEDLVNWSDVLVNIAGAPNLSQTTRTVDFVKGAKAFFRVEEQ